jgi:hypothetical protein
MKVNCLKGIFFPSSLPSGAGSQRPAVRQGRAGVGRGVSEPLTARTAAKQSAREGRRSWAFKYAESSVRQGGNDDE